MPIKVNKLNLAGELFFYGLRKAEMKPFYNIICVAIEDPVMDRMAFFVLLSLLGLPGAHIHKPVLGLMAKYHIITFNRYPALAEPVGTFEAAAGHNGIGCFVNFRTFFLKLLPDEFILYNSF